MNEEANCIQETYIKPLPFDSNRPKM